MMIRDGIPADEIEPYLHARVWLIDADRLLDRTPDHRRTRSTPRSAAAPSSCATGDSTPPPNTPIAAEVLRVPFSRTWPETARHHMSGRSPGRSGGTGDA
jgi:hypothetical protein